MKRFLILFLFLPLFASAQTYSINDLYGKWTGEDNGEIGGFDFMKDGFVKLHIGGEEIGGKNFEMEGVIGSVEYRTNFSQKPYTLDVIMTVPAEELRDSMLFIFEFIDKETIKVGAGKDISTRPKSFEDSNTIILTKTKGKN